MARDINMKTIKAKMSYTDVQLGRRVIAGEIFEVTEERYLELKANPYDLIEDVFVEPYRADLEPPFKELESIRDRIEPKTLKPKKEVLKHSKKPSKPRRKFAANKKK
jgi:hypothetical protein